MRLDVYLFSNGYVKSRQKAKTLIEEGNVTVDYSIIKKPSFEIDEEVEHNIQIKDSCPYVSRGGLKLEKILYKLNLDLSNKIAIDIGASTGGFTHCLLLNGISQVYAVDSGSNQLHESLLNDDRVISMEGFNARDLTPEITNGLVDLIVCDVSFISQAFIIEVAKNLIKNDGIYIGLIKPQFEVGKSKIGKGGIVKDPKYRFEAIKKIVDFASENGLKCIEFMKSPITGGDGNIEYVAAFIKNEYKFGNEIPLTKIKDLYK
ncbi:MAG: TlyA family RNA methyltransferase [Clostridia bacterium]|nr:TlyA family RNA methyltransferase [Clostridia bacterium]